MQTDYDRVHKVPLNQYIKELSELGVSGQRGTKVIWKLLTETKMWHCPDKDFVYLILNENILLLLNSDLHCKFLLLLDAGNRICWIIICIFGVSTCWQFEIRKRQNKYQNNPCNQFLWEDFLANYSCISLCCCRWHLNCDRSLDTSIITPKMISL